MQRETQQLLDSLFCGEVFEISGIGNSYGRKATITGFFQSAEAAATALSKIENQYSNWYYGVNVQPGEMLYRCNGRFQRGVSRPEDHQIKRLRSLFIDFDPVKPLKDISATDTEKAAAIERMGAVVEWVAGEFGMRPFLTGDSGNGGHAHYLIDLENTVDAKKLVERCLKALSQRFSDKVCNIDTATFNPSRLCKLYGTMARKGEHIEGGDGMEARPHRRSRILSIDPEFISGTLEAVPEEALKRLAALYEDPKQKKAKSYYQGGGIPDDVTCDLSEALAGHILSVEDEGGVRKFYIDCPWKDGHTMDGGPKEACVFREGEDGVIRFRCFHDHCSDKKWRDVKEKLGIRVRNGANFGQDILDLTLDPAAAPPEDDFRTLMSDKKFEKLFYKQTKRSSLRSYHNEIVQRALQENWGYQGILNLVVAFNVRHNHMHGDHLDLYYYQKLLHYNAAEYEREIESDHRQSEQVTDLSAAEESSERLRMVNEIMGCSIVEINEYQGVDNNRGLYEIVSANGRKVQGDISMLTRQDPFITAIAHLEKRMAPKIPGRRWTPVVQAMLQCITTYGMPEECTPEGIVKANLLTYLEQRSDHLGENVITHNERYDLARRGIPYRHGDCIHFFGQEFRNWWNGNVRDEKMPREINMIYKSLEIEEDEVYYYDHGRRRKKHAKIISREAELDKLKRDFMVASEDPHDPLLDE